MNTKPSSWFGNELAEHRVRESHPREQFQAFLSMISRVRSGEELLDGVILTPVQADTIKRAYRNRVEELLEEWRSLFEMREGEKGRKYVEEQALFAGWPLTEPPQPRRDSRVSQEFDHLLERLEDTEAATQYWRDWYGEEEDHFCYAVNEVPAVQGAYLARWRHDVGDVPPGIEGLYAIMDGMHAYLADQPPGRCMWNVSEDPTVMQLTSNEPIGEWGGKTYVAFAQQLDAGYLAWAPGEEAVYWHGWGADDPPSHVVDDVPSLLQEFSQHYGLISAMLSELDVAGWQT